jgi:hypothetical protein
MRLRRNIACGCLVACVASLLFCASLAGGQGASALGARLPGGLQMFLQPLPSSGGSSEDRVFQVELRNDSDRDMVLNVGMMLANGRKQYPDAISLLLTAPTGRERQVVLIGPACALAA